MLGASLLDGVPKELMEVIDPHWGQFPPQVIPLGSYRGYRSSLGIVFTPGNFL